MRRHDLDGWRAIKGWDQHSVIMDADIDFDPKTLNLTISTSKPLPQVVLVNAIDSDMFGRATGSKRIAGPLADVGRKRSWNADPRKLS